MLGSSSSQTTLVVTGAGGRVGRLLRAAWSAAPPAGIRLVWTSRDQGPWQDLLAGPLDPAPRGCVILHLAADLSGTPQAAARSRLMAAAVATAARQGRAHHILFASSMAVYAPSDIDNDEAARLDPVTRYGRTKRDAERTCRGFAGEVPVCALRLGNILGADALTAAAERGRRVWLDPVPDAEGGPLRSWIAPRELARILGELVMLVQGGAALPDNLNVASPGPLRMAEILQAGGVDWTYGPPNTSTRPRVTMSMARLNGLVGVRAMTAWDLVLDWRRSQARSGAV